MLCCAQDDIERLLEYVAIGPRFSNVVLQVSNPACQEDAVRLKAAPACRCGLAYATATAGMIGLIDRCYVCACMTYVTCAVICLIRRRCWCWSSGSHPTAASCWSLGQVAEVSRLFLLGTSLVLQAAVKAASS